MSHGQLQRNYIIIISVQEALCVHINILALSCVELHVHAIGCIFSTSVHVHTCYIYLGVQVRILFLIYNTAMTVVPSVRF